jgi:hypothetical protein
MGRHTNAAGRVTAALKGPPYECGACVMAARNGPPYGCGGARHGGP